MKNKLNLFAYLILIFFFNLVQISAQQFKYLSDEIRILDNGNKIVGKNDIEIQIGNNLIISADTFEYSKKLKKLEILGEVFFKDTLNLINATSNKIIYYEDLNIIEIIDNVKLEDKKNNLTLTSSKIIYEKNNNLFKLIGNIFFKDEINKINITGNEIFYSKKLNTVYSNNSSKIIYDNSYFIDLMDFKYNIKNRKLSSKNLTKIKDKSENLFEINGFLLDPQTNKIIGKKIKFVDEEKNNYFLKDVMINTLHKEVFGTDINVKLNKEIFDNNENDPRISARSIKIKNKSSTLKKGVFTSCSDDHDCPPWSVYAEEIKHDKKTKTLNYKNAWLKLYDFPILYFPKFSHPDPTVKRKSGFLTPKFSSSRNLGSSVDIPYFHIISDNKDITFKPKIFLDDELVFQNEYRQVNKSSSHLVDFSLNRKNFLSGKNSTKLHFFSNSNFQIQNEYFDSSAINLKLQKVTNDEYLDVYNIENENLIQDKDLLHSFIDFKGTKNNFIFETSIEAYEDLNKDKSSRYEYIYPKYMIQKNFNEERSNEFYLKTYGSQRQYDTNIYEGILINDIFFESKSNYSQYGFISNINTLIKNVNVDANNSGKYKDKFDQSLSTIFQYNAELPLSRSNSNFIDKLTPKASLMFSPNETKNLVNDNIRVDANKIFSFNRIASNETVEGGSSLTYGVSYSKKNKYNNREIFNIDLASLIRIQENLDLPKNSSLGKKSSDVFGNLELNPNEKLTIGYNFALDNNFNKSNYDSFSTTISLNKLVTTFEYFDEKNNLIIESFTSNSTSYEIDKNNSINFNIRRNNELSATEYYNLIYTYKNDCLIASLKFNKEFYKDSDLKPEKEIFFELSLLPFGGTN